MNNFEVPQGKSQLTVPKIRRARKRLAAPDTSPIQLKMISKKKKIIDQ